MKPPLGHRRLHCLLAALILLAPEYRDAYAGNRDGEDSDTHQEKKLDTESKDAAASPKQSDEKCTAIAKEGSDRLRLIFKAETLKNIATAFNRCNATPQIRVEGRALQGRRYTVMLNADDPNSFLDYLAIDDNIMIEIEGTQRFVVRLRPQNSAVPQRATAGQHTPAQPNVRK